MEVNLLIVQVTSTSHVIIYNNNDGIPKEKYVNETQCEKLWKYGQLENMEQGAYI